MATIAPIVANRGIDPGTAPSTARDDSIGAALRGAGRTVSQIGANLGEMELRQIKQQQAVENFQTEQEWARTKLQIAADYDAAKQGIDPSGNGFAVDQTKAFIGQYDAFLKKVPERLRPEFSQLVQTDKLGRDRVAAADEVAQRNAWYEVGVTDTINGAQTSVATYPEAFDATLADVHRTIDATGLPATKKADLKRSAEEMLGRSWFEAQLRADPAAAKSMLGVGADRSTYYSAIRQAESGGNDAAKNPNSSASGRFQFTESTWNGLAKKYPGSGLTSDGRGDPQQQETAIRLFTAENEQTLKKAGIDGTNANLYAAHFLGAGGAVPVLKAPDRAALAGYVSPEVLTANPFLKGMTVGQFKAWAADKVGGSGGATEAAPEVANLPFAERLKLYDQAAAAENQMATEQAAQAKYAYEAEKGGLELAIEKGEVASAQTILDANLDDGDKATLLSKWNTQQGKDADARAIVEAYSAGLVTGVNPYDADQRRMVGDAYDLLMKSTPEANRGAVTASFVSQTGIVPDQVVATTRQMLNGTTTDAVAQGLSLAKQLEDVAPNGLASVENGRELIDAAAAYDHYVGDRGMSVTEAAQRYIEMNDPKAKEKVDVLKARWKEESKKFSLNDVVASFDDAKLGTPMPGLTPYQQDAITADYLAIAEEKFVDANGDTELARKEALKEINRVYGVSGTAGTDVFGNGTIMKYPPENFYPVIGEDQSYIKAFALKDAKSMSPAATDIMLVSTPETSMDIRAGQPPRYNLLFKGPDGVWDMAPDLFMVGPDDMRQLQAITSEERQTNLALENDYNRLLAEKFPVLNTSAEGGGALRPFLPQPKDIVPNFSQQQQRLVNLDEQRKALLGTDGGVSAPNIDPQLSQNLQTFAAQ